MFIPDHGSELFHPESRIKDPGSKKIPDPGSGSKNLSIFNPKIGKSVSKLSGMFIPDPDLDFLPIPDPGIKEAPDPGSATLHLSVLKLGISSPNIPLLW
jgi:hypothetical protein